MPEICRLCLNRSKCQFSLYTGDFCYKIESLASVKINRNDKLPQTCCKECVDNIHSSYKFQQLIIDSDKILRDRLTNTESQIIEQAKQIPDLFEILHADWQSDDDTVETCKVEVKTESSELNDITESDYFNDKTESDDVNNEWDSACFKSEQAEVLLEETKTDKWYMINRMLNSNSPKYCGVSSLCKEKEVKYIDVQNVEILETNDVDNLYNDLKVMEVSPLKNKDKGNISGDLNSPETLELIKENISKNLNKQDHVNRTAIGLKQQHENKVDVRNKKQIFNRSRIVLKTVEIRRKFDNKLSAHDEKQKAKQKELECEVCNLKFETKRKLQQHMVQHKIHKCPFCFITMRRDNLRRHIRIHTGAPEICEICGKIAKNKESLRGHINYQHKSKGIVKCEVCNKEFKAINQFRAHLKKIHLGIRNQQCHICGKKFFAPHELKKHINVRHLKARPYECQYCKKGFSSPYARKTHLRQHTLETPYRCEICAAGFRQKVSLVGHLKSKHSIIASKDGDSKYIVEPV